MSEDQVKERAIYFSIFGGYVYESDVAEENALDAFQIPLKKKPNSSCDKCYGKFHTGFDVKNRHFIICPSCARKCIDADKIVNRKNVKRKDN